MPSSSSPSSSLWESEPSMSSSSAIDLWENKVVTSAKDGFRRKESIADSFMDASQTSQAHMNHTQQPTSTSSSSIHDITSMEKSLQEATGDCSIAQLDLTRNSTTSCTTINTSGSDVSTSTGSSIPCNNNINIGSVNKSSSKNNSSNKPKGNQSLRNNNTSTTSNVPGGGGGGAATTASSTFSSSCRASGGGASTPAQDSASVITVVNASFDIRKVSALLPPQRLAIPSKQNSQLQSSQNPAKGRSNSTTSSLSAVNNASSSAVATVTFSASPFGSNNGNTATNPPHSSTASTFGSASIAGATVHKTTSSRHGSTSETSCSGGGIQTSSGNGNIKSGSTKSSSKLSSDSEKKPLVQWDSDERLVFFGDSIPCIHNQLMSVLSFNLTTGNMSEHAKCEHKYYDSVSTSFLTKFFL